MAGQTLPVVPVEELRARLGNIATVTDETLQVILDEAARLVGSELPEHDFSQEAVVADAIASIGVKLYDARSRGLVNVDADGTFLELPSASATAGLIRSVRGLLLPVMPTGGIVV